jgi:Family of unknown function (DUF6335)
MTSKRNKRAAVNADQDIHDQNTPQSSSERELFLKQIQSMSTTTPSAGEREVSDQERTPLNAGDPDVSRQGIDTGEETPGGSTPTPDQDMVDEIGKAVGVTYQDNEPLIFDEKYAKRDDVRWENDPASSEDYVERQAALKSDRPRPRHGSKDGPSHEDGQN